MASTLSFDFITDEEFRDALEGDYRELQICAGEQAWKAVHVLAGSLVEAILVEHLSVRQVKPDPEKMSFGDLIEAGKKEGILNQRTAELSHALKSYRNLIHPGRRKRLDEVVDADSAAVAQSLVSMIVRAVAVAQQESYGFTAEQIFSKFETDSSAFGIVDHLLDASPDNEVRRLLVDVLPSRYFSFLEEVPFAHENKEYIRLYRAAFAQASEEVKKAVLEAYVEVFREASGSVVRIYEEHLFRATDLAFATEEHSALIRAHLLAQLREAVNPKLLAAAEGIGGFIDPQGNVDAYVDPFVRAATFNEANSIRTLAARIFRDEAKLTTPELDTKVIARLKAWRQLFEQRDEPARVTTVESLIDAFESWIELAEPTSQGDD